MSPSPRGDAPGAGADPRVAFAFPGVGVTPCGSEPGFLAANRATVAPYLREGSAWAGVDLEEALEVEASAELAPRAFQLLTYAFSCAAAAVYRGAGARPAWIAGYSSGIYAALWAAGCFSYADGLALVAKAYELMAGFVADKGPFAMGVV
ncbi:MAG: hypothetical protein HGA98_06350, partial [Deltaproteobacteria bacterium]|nr:hypothetical protein [Deltaproteobacteria bacterium]